MVRRTAAEELSELLGEKHDIKYLYEEGLDLKKAVKHFDIIKINECIVHLEDWLNRLIYGGGDI